jgi:hypothetical protein
MLVTTTSAPVSIDFANNHQPSGRHRKPRFVDASVAANIATGGAPADIDSNHGVLGVIDHGAGQSHLSAVHLLTRR